MRKALVVFVVLVIAVAGTLYWILANPNRFKGEITQLIAANTDLVVRLEGDLSWRLWPPVQLVAREISADWQVNPADPLLKIDTLELDIDLWPLLDGDSRLVVEGITLTGLDARLIRKGETANWMPPGSTGAFPPPVPLVVPRAAGSESNEWEVAVVVLRDSRLHYDLDGDIYDASIEELILADIAPGRTSPTRAKLTLATRDASYELDARADLTTAANGETIDVTNVVINGTAHPIELPFSATFDARYALHTSTLEVTGAEFTLADVKASANFAATPDRADVSEVTLTYGPTIVKGSASVTLVGRRAVTFELVANEFVLPSTTDNTVSTSVGAGGFASLAFAAAPVAATPTVPEIDAPILPLQDIRSLDWDGKVLVEKLIADRVTFPDARIVTRNDAGHIDGSLELPEFLGGKGNAIWSVDATGTPRWSVHPRVEGVKSEDLLAWLDQKHDWTALLMSSADLEMTGNTTRELTQSLKGTTTFDGGRGRLDIRTLKQQALSVATIASNSERIAKWPEVLDYQRLTGRWNVDGLHHDLTLALDNLSLDAKGTYDPFSKAMDIALAVTVQESTPYQSFDIDPLLMGLPLPVRCTGLASAPDCKADQAAIRRLLGQALTSDNPEMKARLDQAIDEKVPPEYQDAARSLLDLLRQGGQTPPPEPLSPPAPQ